MADARLARTARSDANARALSASESRINASAMSSVHERGRPSSPARSLPRVPEAERRGLRVQARGPSHEQQTRKVHVRRLVYERRRQVRWARLRRAWQRADPCVIPTRVGSRQQARFAPSAGPLRVVDSARNRRVRPSGAAVRGCLRQHHCAGRRGPSLVNLPAIEENSEAPPWIGFVGKTLRPPEVGILGPSEGTAQKVLDGAVLPAPRRAIRPVFNRVRQPTIFQKSAHERDEGRLVVNGIRVWLTSLCMRLESG
jgi:hypothetical protein